MGREAFLTDAARTLEPGSPVKGEYPQSYQLGQKINAWKDDQARQEAKHIQAFLKLRRRRDPKLDSELNCICPGIFIGSAAAAQNLEGLRAAGVTHVLNISQLVPCFYREQFNYMVLQIHDESTEDLASHFQATNAFIREAILQGGVLVHCYAGLSRSAALIMAYLISERNMDHFKSLKLVQRARPGADPNAGFRLQLQALSDARQQSLATDKDTLPQLMEGISDAVCPDISC